MSIVTENGMIRVGIMGYSEIARRRLIPALYKSRKARLTAVARRDPSRNDMAAAGVPTQMMSYEALIADPAIDMIYISLPNHLHEEWSVKALQQGKHVLCEKPLGPSCASVNRMLAVADRQGVLLYENLMYLRHPQHAEVRALLDSGQLGRILALRCVFTFPGPPEGDFRLNPAMDGGAFNDLNRYPLSAADYFLKGQTHSFVNGRMENRNGLNLAMEASSTTDAGVEFSFLIAFEQPYRCCYELTGEQGNLRVERAFTTPPEMENVLHLTMNGVDALVRVPPADHFLLTIDHACSLIHETADFKLLHEQTRKIAALAEMFQKNALQVEVTQ